MTLCPDAEDWLTLSFLPGLGCHLIQRLVQKTGSPEAVLRQGASLRNLPGIGPHIVEVLTNSNQLEAARQRAQRELDLLVRLDISLLSACSPRYPDSLRPFPDSPVLLYYRGDLSWLERPAVAIIGARAATEYGKRTSLMLAAELAAMGITIISGGAYGIDAAAHRGALQSSGGTVAVLGCGIDVTYPRSHARLFQEIIGTGLLVSECPVGTAPEGFRFPARNRIISGLAKGVVVVEATKKSGSLITARLALDQGREVFAIPGRIDSPKSAGTHSLIQQGAHLVQTAADIVDELFWEEGVSELMTETEKLRGRPQLTFQEQKLLDCLETYALDIDNIVRRTCFAVDEVHALLLQLELKSLVRQLPGQLYERLTGL